MGEAIHEQELDKCSWVWLSPALSDLLTFDQHRKGSYKLASIESEATMEAPLKGQQGLCPCFLCTSLVSLVNTVRQLSHDKKQGVKQIMNSRHAIVTVHALLTSSGYKDNSIVSPLCLVFMIPAQR